MKHTSTKAGGSPRKKRISDSQFSSLMVDSINGLRAAKSLEQASSLRTAMAKLTPLQYANHVVGLGGLDLPDPYLPALKTERLEVLHVPHKQGEVLDVIDSRMTLYSGLRSLSMTLNREWTEMVLQFEGQRWKSTNAMEVFAQKYVADYAHGDVLIGGLGLGLVLHELGKSKDVKSITCVEIERDLIDLLSTHFPKVLFVNDDIHKYVDDYQNSGKYDIVYLDTGDDTEGAFYDGVAPLRMKAKHVLRSTANPGNIVCWMEEVMRGQIMESIHNAIAGEFDILAGSDKARESYRDFAKVNVDFFKKFGMLKPGKETSSKVVQFVRDWEMKKDEE